MKAVFKRAIFRRTATWLAIMLIILLAVLPLSAQAVGAPQSPAAANNGSPSAIPFDQIGVEADKQSGGNCGPAQLSSAASFGGASWPV